MSKRNFIALVDGLKSTLGTITDDQRKTLLQQAVQNYGLTTNEATKILNDSGLIAGEKVNYFEVLGLTIEKLENQSESEIKKIVQAEHSRVYNNALAIANNPNFTEIEIKEMKDNANRSKEILTDPVKRKMHIRELTPEPEAIFKFPNGDEATNIPQLATLMAKNARDAVEALYQGKLEQGLRGFGETHFANAARAVVNQYPSNRQIGFLAIVAILHGKIKFRHGSEARTLQQLAHLIDQNWEQSKTLLYNGFIVLWLEYTKQTRLAATAKAIINRNRSEQDIGLEELVQKLDPQIGKPKLEVSRSRIDFGSIDTESQKTIDIQITNRGRGFLYGNIQLATDMPGLQISDAKIRDEGVVSMKLDPSRLTRNKTHQTTLVFSTNGGMVRMLVSCDVSRKVTAEVPDVNKKDKDGQTPLHHAVSDNDYRSVEALIKSGADINAKDKNGYTPLHEASHNDASEIAEILLKYGADVNAKDEYNHTPLYWTAVSYSSKVAEALLKHGADVNAEFDLVSHAAMHNAPKVAEVLLKHGANVNEKTYDGYTPLHKAATRASSEIAEILLKYGADVNAENKHGTTPLRTAVDEDRFTAETLAKTVEVLLKHDANVNEKDKYGNTPLHDASRKNAVVDTAEILLRNGADVSAENKYGSTPLHIAAENDADEVVEVLLRYGADVNAENESGLMPLHLAKRNYAHKTVKILSAKSGYSKTQLLHTAIKKRDYERVKALINSGADVNAKNKDGETPLIRAVSCLWHEAVKVLLENGADVNAKNKDGETPLHIAVSWGDTERVRILLENGADVNAKNNKAQTPLHIAGGQSRVVIALELLENGADADAKDDDGYTPLQWAKKNSASSRLVKLLRKHSRQKGMLWW